LARKWRSNDELGRRIPLDYADRFRLTMLVQPHYAVESMTEVRRLIARHGWALLLTDDLQAAHLPCLLDPELDGGGQTAELVVIGHVARSDPAANALTTQKEVLLVFQGPQGYVSPAWYGAGPTAPTWNFTVVHVYGVAEVLDGDAGFTVLERTVEHFEAERDPPWQLDHDARAYAHTIAAETISFRIRATRVLAKAKLSQDKPRAVQERVVASLEQPGPYQQPELAAEMRRVLGIPGAEA
jgi:transcriptional regulator